MVFWEHKKELFWCLSLTEGTDVVVNSVDEDVWGSEDEITGTLSDGVESWYWLCFYICPMSFPMTNSKTKNIKW